MEEPGDTSETTGNFRAELNAAIEEGIRRIEDMASGRVKELSEEEFRAALE